MRILGYHRIADVPGDSLSVSPSAFKRQMELVTQSGAESIRLVDALALLDEPVAGRYVCITFDDAYRDNLDEAEPILAALELPATIFVPTAIVSGDATFFWYSEPPPALSWDEIAAMQDRGVFDFQSHTRTHPWLPRLGDDSLQRELEGSMRELEVRLDRPAQVLAYPAGLCGPREAVAARAAGYRACVTTDPGINAAAGDPMRLRRTLVYGDDSEERFVLKLRGGYDGSGVLRSSLMRRLARGPESSAYDPL